jgi:hypothetical protein
MKPELLQFLATTAAWRPGNPPPPVDAELRTAIETLMHEDHFIAKIKIYNRQGAVVYSTHPEEVGEDHTTNKGYLAALQGAVRTDLVYRDTFNSYDLATEEDNLVQTYLPVRHSAREPVQGVFELYGDVNDLVHQAERMQFVVLVGGVPILLALYGVLILVVRHANRTIEQQQQTIQERNESLALMAAHVLRSDESHKRRVALDLHEGVAQTLAALKLKAEGRRGVDDSIVPLLQEAIQEVRTIATELRPSSLDDLGLLPTLNSMRNAFEHAHPELLFQQRITLQEAEVPAALKGILHRIVASVLEEVAARSESGDLSLSLGLTGRTLTLQFDLALTDRPPAAEGAAPAASFSLMEELATLSGGTFTATPQPGGRVLLRADWKG